MASKSNKTLASVNYLVFSEVRLSSVLRHGHGRSVGSSLREERWEIL